MRNNEHYTRLKASIEQAFDARNTLTPNTADPEITSAVTTVIDALNQGELRVAEKTTQGAWIVHQWIKKAVLLYFRLHDNQRINGQFTRFFDKVPLKYANYTQADFEQQGVRVVPPACSRYGSYIAPNVVLMPSYVNIGAYVDTGTMVDTFATVGSCAQIGKNVHLAGGVGIGGVLEPLQANPTIIEDDCFIGSRAIVVEGVIVKKGAVLSMGVSIGQSTKIYHRETGEITYGLVPEGAVVIPGSLPDKTGQYSLYCAVIVKQVDEKTRQKVGINALLREAASNSEQ